MVSVDACNVLSYRTVNELILYSIILFMYDHDHQLVVLKCLNNLPLGGGFPSTHDINGSRIRAAPSSQVRGGHVVTWGRDAADGVMELTHPVSTETMDTPRFAKSSDNELVNILIAAFAMLV